MESEINTDLLELFRQELQIMISEKSDYFQYTYGINTNNVSIDQITINKNLKIKFADNGLINITKSIF